MTFSVTGRNVWDWGRLVCTVYECASCAFLFRSFVHSFVVARFFLGFGDFSRFSADPGNTETV